MWCFVIVWTSDIAAFTFGKIFKGPKLAKKISPNKTWSGFLCSIFLAILSSILFSHFFYPTDIIYSGLIGFLTCLLIHLNISKIRLSFPV